MSSYEFSQDYLQVLEHYEEDIDEWLDAFKESLEENAPAIADFSELYERTPPALTPPFLLYSDTPPTQIPTLSPPSSNANLSPFLMPPSLPEQLPNFASHLTLEAVQTAMKAECASREMPSQGCCSPADLMLELLSDADFSSPPLSLVSSSFTDVDRDTGEDSDGYLSSSRWATERNFCALEDDNYIPSISRSQGDRRAIRSRRAFTPYPSSSLTGSSSPSILSSASASPASSRSSTPKSRTHSNRPRNVQVSKPRDMESLMDRESLTCLVVGCTHPRLSRLPDLTRHVQTHLSNLAGSRWACLGLPSQELGADTDELSTFGLTFNHDGKLMVGGCLETFSRLDAYQRHLKSGKCAGDRGGYRVGLDVIEELKALKAASAPQ